MREEPCGSHHDAARALKCATSEALTEVYEDCDGEEGGCAGFELGLEVLLCHLRHDGRSVCWRNGDGRA